MLSSNPVVLSRLGPFKVGETKPLIHLLLGPEYLDLPDVRVLAAVLVLQNTDLNVYGQDVVFLFATE